MKKNVLAGLAFVVAGVACIFPFIRSLILENIVVMLGVYLIYRGYLYITDSSSFNKARRSGKKNHEGAIDIEEGSEDKKD